MQVEIEDIDGGRATASWSRFISAPRAAAAAIEVEIRSYNVYTFRDGKVTRMQLFIEREHALEAAGLTERHTTGGEA